MSAQQEAVVIALAVVLVVYGVLAVFALLTGSRKWLGVWLVLLGIVAVASVTGVVPT